MTTLAPPTAGPPANGAPIGTPTAGASRIKTVVRPPAGWPLPDVRELWRYRDLLALLTTRNVAARYRQSVLGVGWAVVRPLISMTIFTLIFGMAMGVQDSLPPGIPYAVFALCGLIPWMFFAAALAGTTDSVVGGQDMLTKVYFPRLVLPLSNLGVAAVDLAIQLVLLVGVLAWFQIWPGLTALALPAFLLLAAAAALAGGLWLTALNVKYRDVNTPCPSWCRRGCTSAR